MNGGGCGLSEVGVRIRLEEEEVGTVSRGVIRAADAADGVGGGAFLEGGPVREVVVGCGRGVGVPANLAESSR